MKDIAKTTRFTPEVCGKWLTQLSEIKDQIMAHYDGCNIKECIKGQLTEIENNLDVTAIDISEMLKQQSLNDKYFEHKHNN